MEKQPIEALTVGAIKPPNTIIPDIKEKLVRQSFFNSLGVYKIMDKVSQKMNIIPQAHQSQDFFIFLQSSPYV